MGLGKECMKNAIRTIAGILVASGAVAFAQQGQQQEQASPPQDQQKSQPGQGAAALAENSAETLGTKEKPIRVVAAQAETRGAVVDKNQKLRTLTVKTADGAKSRMKVCKEVENFGDIKEGDQVDVTCFQETAIALQKAADLPSAAIGHAVLAPEKGEPPAAAGEVTTVESALMNEDIDYDNRTITLKAPDGTLQTMHVGDGVTNLRDFQKGEQVAVRATEALALKINKRNE